MKRLPLLLACLLLSLPACSTVSGWFGGSGEKKPKLEGERVDIIADEVALKPSPTLESDEVEVPEAVSPAVWPQSGGTPNHYQPNIAATLAEDRASASVGKGEEWAGAIVPSPVATRDAVIAMDGRGIISAHKKGSLDALWMSKAGKVKKSMFGGGLAADASHVYAVTGNGRVFALDATNGKTLWMKELQAPARSAPLLLEQSLVVVTVDSQLFALDLTTGNTLWQHRGISEQASLLGSSVPAANGPLIVTAYNSGEVYALSRRDGSPIWNDSLLSPVKNRAADAFTGVSGNPVIAGRFVYTVSTNGILSANDLRTGFRAWEQRIASRNAPWIAGDYLYVLDVNDALYCLKRDGRIKWVQSLLSGERDAEEPLPALHGPYMVNGQLLTIDPAGKAILADPKDGKVIASRDFVEGVTSAPAFSDGGLYVEDKASKLHFVK